MHQHKGRAYMATHSLNDTLWDGLSASGFDVEVIPQDHEPPQEFDGRRYYVGLICQQGAAIKVVPGPGHPSPKSPFYGKLLIWVEVDRSRSSADEQTIGRLLNQIGEALQGFGAEPWPPKGDTTGGTESKENG